MMAVQSVTAGARCSASPGGPSQRLPPSQKGRLRRQRLPGSAQLGQLLHLLRLVLPVRACQLAAGSCWWLACLLLLLLLSARVEQSRHWGRCQRCWSVLKLKLKLRGPWDGGQAQGSEGGGAAGEELGGFWLCEASWGLWSCPLGERAWLQAGAQRV